MNIKQGYKQTEIGIIPEDWEVKHLNDICRPSSTRINPLTVIENRKCVELEHLEQATGKLIGFADLKDLKSQKAVFEKNDVLFGKLRPYLRKFLFAEFNGACTTEIWVLKPQKEIESKWLYYLIQSDKIIEAANQSTGTKMPRAEWKTVGNTQISLPKDKQEQTAIATALSDIDALIGELDKLIAKKQGIKQATMQQLLTGKKRLAGFSGEWEVKEIRDVLSVIMDCRGRTPKKLGMEWGGGEIRALSAGNVKMGRIDFDAENYIGSENLYKKWMTQGHAQKNDVLMTTEAPLGNVALIPDSKKYILSQRIILLRANNEILDCLFLFHTLISESFQNLLKKDSSGSTATGIQRLKFEKIKISFPSLAEQTAIANILSDMYAEISQLEGRRAKMGELKLGMMQELLTGRIRLNTLDSTRC